VEDNLLKPSNVIFEGISPSTRKKDEKLEKEIYKREEIPYLVLVYPDLKKAKIYKLTEKGYKKVLDAVKNKFTFKLKGCKVELDFGSHSNR